MRCSVIVPLYNKAPFVRRALDSIRLQSYREFEVFIVDDGSTDESAREVAAFLADTNDSRFQFLQQKNAGPGAARNRGVAEANGDFVSFLDADDEWLPNFLETALRSLDESAAEVAGVTLAWFDEPGHRSVVPSTLGKGLKAGTFHLVKEADAGLLLALMVYMWPCTTMVRTALFRRYGGFREKQCMYAEDVFLWLKIVLNHPVRLEMSEAALFHRESSGLSGNYRHVRPVEPFLEDPQEIRQHCPEPLRPVLEKFLAMRAFKTALVLSYWGNWRAGLALRRKFSPAGAWRLQLYFPALVGATPIGPLAGRLWRFAGGKR